MHPHSYLGLCQLPLEEVQGLGVASLALLQALELLLQLPLQHRQALRPSLQPSLTSLPSSPLQPEGGGGGGLPAPMHGGAVSWGTWQH